MKFPQCIQGDNAPLMNNFKIQLAIIGFDYTECFFFHTNVDHVLQQICNVFGQFSFFVYANMSEGNNPRGGLPYKK